MEKIMIPPLDLNRAEEVRTGWAKMDKLGSLGRLEEMVVDYAAMTGKPLPEKIKTAMLLMCGDHGIGECYGSVLDLPKCIAKGDDICALRYHKKDVPGEQTEEK